MNSEHEKMSSVDFDDRWVGPHGIGRFAKEIEQRLQFGGRVKLPLSPTNPFDVVLLTVRHLMCRKRIVFSPGYNAPLFGLKRYVLTVHDLNHIDFPGTGWLKKQYYNLVLKRACRNAAKVLTVSDYSKRRIVEWSGVDADQVVNVGNGVGQQFTVNGDRYDGGAKYVLMVSNRKPHKNETRMLEAFAAADIPIDVRLLITGEPTLQLLRLIDQLQVGRRAEFIGQCSDEKLASLYRGAEGLLFVSLYEGFGLPVIEAMACGAPVITSNVCSLPEVAGDGALIVAPEDVGQIRAALEKLLSGGVEFRESLSSRGQKRAREFSWDTVSGRIESVLRSLSVT